MKHIRTISFITILFCILVFIFTIFDFMALHDIKQDYVSGYILNYLEINLSNDLPDWTSAEGEWRVVSFSFYLRFLFFILNTTVLIYFFKKLALNKSRT